MPSPPGIRWRTTSAPPPCSARARGTRRPIGSTADSCARIHLAARPDLPPDGDPALFASLNETVGRPINQWAFGDVPGAVAIIRRVLAWHSANDDPFTPKAQFPAAHVRVHAGLEALVAKMLADQDRIREQRRANGLPNRT